MSQPQPPRPDAPTEAFPVARSGSHRRPDTPATGAPATVLADAEPPAPPVAPSSRRRLPWVAGGGLLVVVLVLVVVGFATGVLGSGSDDGTDAALSSTVPTAEDTPSGEAPALPPTAAAPPSGPDADFLQALDDKGIKYSSPDAAVTAGHGLCDALDQGLGPQNAAVALSGSGTYPPAQSASVLRAAVAAYCPQHQGDL